jgi:hypothetical protein
MRSQKATAVLVSLALAFTLLACAGSFENATQAGGDTEPIVYLKNNIHGTERISGSNRSIRASFLNFVGDYPHHAIIPINTPVKVQKISTRGITLTCVDNGTQVVIEYNAKLMAPMTPEAYIGVITAPTRTTFSELSRIDQKGIADGQAYLGMSKDAVRMALGYPALHRTPSLKDNTWSFWRNRFVEFTVAFDAAGKVSRVQ